MLKPVSSREENVAGPDDLAPPTPITPSSRVWKGLAACAAFCVVAGGAASVLHLGVIGVGGAKSSGPATFSSREATGFSMENSCLLYTSTWTISNGKKK